MVVRTKTFAELGMAEERGQKSAAGTGLFGSVCLHHAFRLHCPTLEQVRG